MGIDDGMESEVNELKSVICHNGSNSQGHNIAFIHRNNEWLKCDDQFVKHVDFHQIGCVSYQLLTKIILLTYL